MLDIKFNEGFIETIEQSNALNLADTDSLYATIDVINYTKNKILEHTGKLKKLPQVQDNFNKYDPEYWANAIEIANMVAEEINNNIEFLMSENGQIGQRAGLDPEYQRLFFKTEMIGQRLLTFDIKKTYALTYFYDEGKRLDKPAAKYTGGLIKKSSTPKISKDILKEIYDLMLFGEYTKIDELEMKIFRDIFKKYKDKFNEALENIDLNYIGFPYKYGFGANETKWTWGAKFFNTFFHDEIRPGASMYALYIRYNVRKLENILPITTDNNFKLCKADVKDKWDMISVQIESSENFKEKWSEVLEYLAKEIDLEFSYDRNFDNEVAAKFKMFKGFFS